VGHQVEIHQQKEGCQMMETYCVRCNLIEVDMHKDKVMDIVRGQKCIGYSGIGDSVTFHFLTDGQAMMAFLELEGFLTSVSASMNPLFINNKFLKGVFNYD
jgi:hypothetical protein